MPVASDLWSSKSISMSASVSFVDGQISNGEKVSTLPGQTLHGTRGGCLTAELLTPVNTFQLQKQRRSSGHTSG